MRLIIVLTAATVLIGKSQQSLPLYEYHGPWAPLSNDGTVIDTSEVAQARSAHLAAHAATTASLAKAQTDLSSMRKSDTATEVPSETSRTVTNIPIIQQDNSQTSMAPLGQNGNVVDTAEVAVAKAQHLAAHARVAANYEFDAYKHVHRNLIYLSPIRLISPIVYRGAPAPLGPDGRVVDTPEVAVARAAHIKAHARAVALTTGYNVRC